MIQQYEHAFFLAASLEPVDALDGFVVGRVASDAPDRVRRIEDDTAFAQHFEKPDKSVRQSYSHIGLSRTKVRFFLSIFKKGLSFVLLKNKKRTGTHYGKSI